MKTRLPFTLAVSGILALAMLAALPPTLGAGQATSAAYSRDELFRPGAVRDVRGAGAPGSRLPARRHRHGHGLARRPGQPPRLGDLQPPRQGRQPALHVLRPLLSRTKAAEPVVRVLEGPLTPPFTAGTAIRRGRGPGPAAHGKGPLSSASIPSPRSSWRTASCPLEVTLEAFNPFIPLKPEESGIPAAVIRFRVEKPERQARQDHDRRLGPQSRRLRRRRHDRRPRPRQVRRRTSTRSAATPSLSGLFMSSTQGQAGARRRSGRWP